MPDVQPLLHILPPAQMKLWPELTSVPAAFTLYGGTALALRLGHRSSVDFDFFSNAPFDPDRLAASVPFLRDAERIQVEANTLTCRVERGAPVLVSFFGGLGLGVIEAPARVAGQGFGIASLLDLAGTKAAVIQKRAEPKDYLDINALVRHGIDLPTILAAGRAVYGRAFNPLISVKAIGYFGDVPNLPRSVQANLSAAVAQVDTTALPILAVAAPRADASA